MFLLLGIMRKVTDVSRMSVDREAGLVYDTQMQRIWWSVLLVLLAALLSAQDLAVSRRHGSVALPRPLVGAIRWDAWHGKQGVPGRAVEASLSPAKWHYRLPFFAQVVAESEVSIDGASQEVMDREIAYAKQAGLDYWAFVTYDESDPMSLGLRHYLASSHRGDIHFCQIVTYQPGSYREQIARTARLMRNPAYQKVLDGRPLLYVAFFIQAQQLKAPGAAAGYRKMLDELRGLAREGGAGDPYIVAMDFDPARTADLRAQVGGDAIGSYATQNNEAAAPYSALAAAAQRFWDRSKATGSNVVPIVMSGWDRRPRVERPVPWEKQAPGAGLDKYYEAPTPLELAAHLERSLLWIQDNPASCPAKLALIYAWNENDEGGWLVPTLDEGTARLDAIARILRR